MPGGQPPRARGCKRGAVHARCGESCSPRPRTASPLNSTTGRRGFDRARWFTGAWREAGTERAAHAGRARCPAGGEPPLLHDGPLGPVAPRAPNPNDSPAGRFASTMPLAAGLAPPLAQLASQLPGTFARPASEAAPAAEGVEPARPRDDRAAGGISCDPGRIRGRPIGRGSRRGRTRCPRRVFYSRTQLCARARPRQQPLSCSHCCCCCSAD